MFNYDIKHFVIFVLFKIIFHSQKSPFKKDLNNKKSKKGHLN